MSRGKREFATGKLLQEWSRAVELVDQAVTNGSRERVVGDAAVRLIFAGWLPQDGLFGWSVALSLGGECGNENRCYS